MNKAQLSTVLATALGAAGIGYTAGQLSTAADSVQEQVVSVVARPQNDCQVAIVTSAAKAPAVAAFLDEKFAELDPDFIPSENGMKNLAHKVATRADPLTVVAYATQFRLPSNHADLLKSRADLVTGVSIGAIKECSSEQLDGEFSLPGEDGGIGLTETRPYKSLAEFLGAQTPPLQSYKDPDLP